MRGETWQVYCLGKRNALRLDLKEAREGFCWRGKGRSFREEELKMEKARDQQVLRALYSPCCL